jgi:hypothetical protein
MPGRIHTETFSTSMSGFPHALTIVATRDKTPQWQGVCGAFAPLSRPRRALTSHGDLDTTLNRAGDAKRSQNKRRADRLGLKAFPETPTLSRCHHHIGPSASLF